MNALPRKERITKEEIVQSIAQVARYQSSFGYQVEGSLSDQSLSELKSRAVTLTDEIQSRQTQLDQIDIRSRRKANAICWLGSSIVIG